MDIRKITITLVRAPRGSITTHEYLAEIERENGDIYERRDDDLASLLDDVRAEFGI